MSAPNHSRFHSFFFFSYFAHSFQYSYIFAYPTTSPPHHPKRISKDRCVSCLRRGGSRCGAGWKRKTRLQSTVTCSGAASPGWIAARLHLAELSVFVSASIRMLIKDGAASAQREESRHRSEFIKDAPASPKDRGKGRVIKETQRH